MRAFIDKLILFTACFLFSLHCYPELGTRQVLSVLFSFILLCLCTYCNPNLLPVQTLPRSARCAEYILWIVFLLAALAEPLSVPFLPLLFYEVAQRKAWYLTAAVPVAFLLSRPLHSVSCSLLYLLLFALAFLSKCKTLRLLQLEQDFRQLRDTSTEYNLLLQQKNKELIRQQDSEIHVATLQERNRIAREIHDNVGHMLSRSILQSGALIAINKDPNLNEPLACLKDTLSLAMNSIRESVHDLHDDSIDLEFSLRTMLQDFSEYDISLEYDMDSVLPKDIKYCFIAIAKEALSNISRHSNATRVKITAREHPSFYQLVIADNGTDISTSDPGIGLINMRDRVEQLHGHFSVTTEAGFRIFVSVPRTH